MVVVVVGAGVVVVVVVAAREDMDESGSSKAGGSDVAPCAWAVPGALVVDAEFSWCRRSAGAATMLFCEAEAAAAEADASPTADGTCWVGGRYTTGIEQVG